MLIIIGIAIAVIIIFALIWSYSSGNNQPTECYSPIVIKDENVSFNTKDEPLPPNEPYISFDEEQPSHPDTPIQPVKKEIIRPIKPKKAKIVGEIVPLYSKKRRSKGENMCARALEEIFGVPFPSERPKWAMGKKGRPLEYDCINH